MTPRAKLRHTQLSSHYTRNSFALHYIRPDIIPCYNYYGLPPLLLSQPKLHFISASASAPPTPAFTRYTSLALLYAQSHLLLNVCNPLAGTLHQASTFALNFLTKITRRAQAQCFPLLFYRLALYTTARIYSSTCSCQLSHRFLTHHYV